MEERQKIKGSSLSQDEKKKLLSQLKENMLASRVPNRIRICTLFFLGPFRILCCSLYKLYLLRSDSRHALVNPMENRSEPKATSDRFGEPEGNQVRTKGNFGQVW